MYRTQHKKYQEPCHTHAHTHAHTRVFIRRYSNRTSVVFRLHHSLSVSLLIATLLIFSSGFFPLSPSSTLYSFFLFPPLAASDRPLVTFYILFTYFLFLPLKPLPTTYQDLSDHHSPHLLQPYFPRLHFVTSAYPTHSPILTHPKSAIPHFII